MAKKAKQEILGNNDVKDWNKRFGEDAVLGDTIKIRPYIGTGSISLDMALTYPIVEGSIIEIAGAESTGKTTTALEITVRAQKDGYTTFYFDLENRLEAQLLSCIKDLDLDNWLRIRPENGNLALEQVCEIIRECPKAFIIIDSIPAIVHEAIMAKSMSEDTMAKGASLLHKFCKKNMQVIAKTGAIVVFINQTRDSLDPYKPGPQTPGGKAMKFFAQQRIMMKTNKKDLILDDAKNPIGHYIECKVVKNSYAAANRVARVPIIYGKGISRLHDLFDCGMDLGIITRGGPMYTYNGVKYKGKNEILSEFKTKPDILDMLERDLRELNEENNISECNDGEDLKSTQDKDD